MESLHAIPSTELGNAAQFATTHWSVVFQAADAASPHAQAALGSLYQAYFYPLYFFARRKGYSEHDAQDLLHDFFYLLIEKNYLKSVARECGRFRAFLLAALNHFMANQWRRAHCQKRGGDFTLISLDQLSEQAELKFQAANEVHGSPCPEVEFEMEWARTVLARVMKLLRQELLHHPQRLEQFDVFKVYLSREGNAAEYAALAADMGMKEGAVKVAVHRLRRRFQELLRREIAATVTLPVEVEDELHHLVEVLRRQG
jgi:DNA-directed RNA polymerase specialized sigma24 family protein